MHPSLKTLSAACASALLVACADMSGASRSSVPGKTPAGLSADDAYILGRQQHLAARWPAAIDHYQAALRANPRHVNASNGLATLYAEQGNLPKAIGVWRELTIDAPDSAASAFIHSNLGYAYLLNGDFQLAIASLEKACVLDPFSARAWRHLGDALVKVGEDERAQRMFRQADALDKHDLRHDLAVTAAQATPAKPVVDVDAALTLADQASATASAAVSSPEMPPTEIRQTGSALYELHRVTRSIPVSAASPAVTAVPKRPAPAVAAREAPPPVAIKQDEEAVDPPVRVEIRNGNGVTGMARGLSRAIADDNTQVVRLSNDKGFKVARTRVEYQAGFEDAARRLAERFGGDAVAASLNDKTDLRLVLGRDMARSKMEARRVIRAALARAAKAG